MAGKSTVSLSISFEKFKIKLDEGKIIDYFFSSVRPLTSGAHIPISQKHVNKKVLILVLDEQSEEKNDKI